MGEGNDEHDEFPGREWKGGRRMSISSSSVLAWEGKGGEA